MSRVIEDGMWAIKMFAFVNIISAVTKQMHKLKLKGTGPIEYHLGCDFFRDKFGVLCMTPRTYIHKILSN